MQLFCPGPVNVHESIKNKRFEEISHRGLQFQTVFKDCTKATKELFSVKDNSYMPLFLTGSGTLAVESMIFSYLKKKKTLILQNGFFGEKWEFLMKTHGANYDLLNFGWCNEYDYNAITANVVTNKYDCIFMVHHETSTTMINDLDKMNDFCRKYNLHLVVDAVSSVGIYPIDLNKLNTIALLGYSTNKCIGSYPGLSVVITKISIISEFSNELSYLNLQNYCDFAKKYETPYTPCIQNFFYYTASVNYILKDTNRKDTYETLLKYLIDKVRLKGLVPLIDKNQCCWVINFKCKDPESLYSTLQSNNISVYKCKSYLSTTCIQIAIINKSKEDIDAFISCINT